MGRAKKQLIHQFHNFFFHISKCLASNSEKTLQLKITKKKKKKLSLLINILIYIPTLYVTTMTQNKNDSTNSNLQHGRVVQNNCCVVFPTSGFPYFKMCPR